MFIGGKKIVTVALDAVEGPQKIELVECGVIKSSTANRVILHSYNLKGTDSSGKERTFSIDKSTYYDLNDKTDFTVQIIGWEHSKVAKEIVDVH